MTRDEEIKKEALKQKLEIANSIKNNPKADRLYEIAWELGHSSGYQEVEYYYDELVDLIK